MSLTTSPSTSKCYGFQRVCKIWEVARFSFNSAQTKEWPKAKPGPKPSASDADLIELIKMVIAKSPFTGEGHRKIHARLKRKNVRVGRNRI